ncbi:hypothetical protein ACJX0J_026544, partial [Zea mays]
YLKKYWTQLEKKLYVVKAKFTEALAWGQMAEFGTNNNLTDGVVCARDLGIPEDNHTSEEYGDVNKKKEIFHFMLFSTLGHQIILQQIDQCLIEPQQRGQQGN